MTPRVIHGLSFATRNMESTLQNENLGDLQLEFASAPERAEELPREELGPALGAGTLSKYSRSLISRTNDRGQNF